MTRRTEGQCGNNACCKKCSGCTVSDGNAGRQIDGIIKLRIVSLSVDTVHSLPLSSSEEETFSS